MTLRLRSPAIALRQEGLDVRGRCILHQPWPCGRSRRPCRASGRRASFLNVHVHTTHTTSRSRHSASSTECRRQQSDGQKWPGRAHWHARGCRCTLTQTAPSSWTARLPSVVVDAIELACAGVAHKARAALSGLSGRRHGHWCRVRAPSSGRRSGPSDFFQPFVTQMSHILTQRA